MMDLVLQLVSLQELSPFYIVTLPIGVVLGCCAMWYMMRHRQGHTLEHPEQKMEQMQEAIYDEPLETTIHLSDNQAYGLSK